MTKVLVLYYSMYGHTESLANSVADGASEIAGVDVTIKRVAELMPEDVALGAGAKLDQVAEFAEPSELGDYDAIVVGSPTRFGNMCSQMRNFWDQTGPLWSQGALSGKLGSAFTSTGTGSGNETTIVSIYNTFIHHGMIVVGIDPMAPQLKELSSMRGGSIYGAAAIAAVAGNSGQPSDAECALAHEQGRRVAEIAAQLTRGRKTS